MVTADAGNIGGHSHAMHPKVAGVLFGPPEWKVRLNRNVPTADISQSGGSCTMSTPKLGGLQPWPAQLGTNRTTSIALYPGSSCKCSRSVKSRDTSPLPPISAHDRVDYSLLTNTSGTNRSRACHPGKPRPRTAVQPALIEATLGKPSDVFGPTKKF